MLIFEWLFQQALVSGHKGPTYKNLASSSIDDVYRAIPAWGVINKQCLLGTHTNFSKTDDAHTNNYDSSSVAGRFIVLTLVQI